jgi:uncharacterized membrane protein
MDTGLVQGSIENGANPPEGSRVVRGIVFNHNGSPAGVGAPPPADRRVSHGWANWRWTLPLALLALGLVLVPAIAHEGPGFWGAGVCHRIVERSFVVAGVQLPLCARCTGVFIAFLTTVVVCFLRGRRRPADLPPPGVTVALFMFLVIVGVDGLNSYLALFPALPHLYEPSNTLRLLTGSLEGVALASFLQPILHMTLWQKPQEVRSIPNFRELGLVVLASWGVGLLALWHPPFSLYPLTVLSLAGLFVALSTVNTLLVALVAGRVGRVIHWSEALALFGWGCVVAMLEIAAMAWFRYWLIGSFSLSLG